MVLTTKDVIANGKPILVVFHDEDDGMWQFHSGDDVDMGDAVLISLREMIELDSSLVELVDLPLGWVAWRNNANSHWYRKINE
ncbi:MAG TPA: hypothetical protein GX497_02870 [Bacillus bacterium]|nr:hypothetical protein [Bacillus sp. (in: firmicutes)]